MIYVLTFEVNDYDQYGECFVHAWTDKPSAETLLRWMEQAVCLGSPPTPELAKRVLTDGGGRYSYSMNQWWYLKTIPEELT